MAARCASAAGATDDGRRGTTSVAPSTNNARSARRADTLRRVRCDHRLRAAPRGRMCERVANLRQWIARSDQALHAELRHQRERPAERGAATERATDGDL